MSLLKINFTFYKVDHSELSNDFIFQKRRAVVEMFKDAGFGDIVENGENKFANEFATPVEDTLYLPENDLFISYAFVFPARHGDISELLTNGIPKLFHNVNSNNLPFRLIVHTIFT